MANICTNNTNMIRLRDFSSVFSRFAFTNVLNFNDYSHYDWLISKYSTHCNTYTDLIRRAYSVLAKDYCCEYVLKNELIKSLLKKYGTVNTIFFNEFRVGKSIADIVMFNGESKAFEIKTEFDSPRRLNKQMADYKKIFDKCYIVIPEEKYEDYCQNIEPQTGIIIMRKINGRIYLEEIKNAIQNQCLDANILISCLRTEEYMNIVTALGINIDGVSGYDMFTFCLDALKDVESSLLRKYFLQEIKKRKSNSQLLKKYPMQLKQMILSLNLPEKKAYLLLEKLNTNIIHQ